MWSSFSANLLLLNFPAICPKNLNEMPKTMSLSCCRSFSFIPLLNWGVCSSHFTHCPPFFFSNNTYDNLLQPYSFRAFVLKNASRNFRNWLVSSKSTIFEVKAQWEYPWSLDTDWRRALVEGLHAAASHINIVLTFNLMGFTAVFIFSRCSFALLEYCSKSICAFFKIMFQVIFNLEEYPNLYAMCDITEKWIHTVLSG